MADDYGDGLLFYAGSRLLAPFSRLTGWNIDKINFLACQTVALVFAYYFRTSLSPSKTSPVTRHVVQLLVGLCMTYFCYGYQTWSVVLQTITCLILMKSLQPGLMEKAVFVVSLSWLCIAHIYRQYYDYGGYTLDITGPLMMNTQRMSSIAFSLVDGQRKDFDQLSPSLRRQAIRQFPSLLNVFSYMFCFTTASCGPFIFYNDYIQFIEGKQLQTKDKLQALVIQKFLTGAIAGMILLTIIPMFPLHHIIEPEFSERGIISKTFYILVCTSLVRNKYYFAWKMAEAANHNAGLGFRGYSKQGEEEWDLVDNLKIRNVELSTSLKVLLDNWNISTTLWLRHVIYVRVPFMNTLAVFFVSALWHGFYPGYYFTFFTASLFITAARLVRRNVRPYFQESADMSRLYDVITFVMTRISIGYLTFPFVLLEFMPSFHVYTQMYWWLHILSAATIVFFTFIHPGKKRKPKEEKPTGDANIVMNGTIGDKKAL